MSDFDLCLAFTLRMEGGKVDDPKDPGGRTNQGVTQGVYDVYRVRKGLPKQSVYAIAPIEVSDIYRNQYWLPTGCDNLPSGVNLLAFDIAVNMGIGRIRPWLAASVRMTPGDRIRYLDQQRRGFWRHLSIFGRFGKGWFHREDACLALALKMDAPKATIAIAAK